MDYSLGGVYSHILDLTDKKGSDLHQLPTVRNAFINSTHDFLRERIGVIEATQKVSQDVQDLIKTKKQTVADNPANEYTVLAAVPNDSFHVVSIVPIFDGNVRARRQRLVRWGDREALKADPHNEPTIEYPHIFTGQDYFEIDSGYNEKALFAFVTYIQNPTFASLDSQSTRIVNLSDQVIDDLVLKTVDTLFGIVADPRTENAYRKEQSFGKITR